MTCGWSCGDRASQAQQFDFDRPDGDGHNQAMVAWAGTVREAVTSGNQISPSFADGVACMRVMDQWRAEPPPVPTGRDPGQHLIGQPPRGGSLA